MSLEQTGATGHGDNTAVSLLEVDGDRVRVVFRDDAGHVPAQLSTFRRQSWHKGDAATEPGLWFRTLREDDAGRTVEALAGETPAGQVSMSLERSALRVTDYRILPAQRGRHYGVQLLGQAVQFARRQNRETLVLACPPELAAYFAKYGFAPAAAGGLVLDIRRVVREIPALE